MDEFNDFIKEVKNKADLLQIIEETGPEYAFETARRGKYIYGKKHDSLMVDVSIDQYTWFSRAGSGGHQYEGGDVLDWMTRYRNMDFWDAAVYLAQKYGVKVPDLKEANHKDQAKSYQARGELYTVAHEWFVKQLWSSPAALDYCRKGRGWADETICYKVSYEMASEIGNPYQFTKETMTGLTPSPHGVGRTMLAGSSLVRGAGLGFSPGTVDSAEELRARLQLQGIDLKAPEAVAMIGLKGGVGTWCKEHSIEAQPNWLEKDRIFGLAEFTRLIYPHFGRGGAPVYFSARNLKWSSEKLISEPDKKKKSYNPPELLAGQRMWFFNWLFHKKVDEVVVVEGQADAITIGEWGIPAIALNGLSANQELAVLIRDVRKRFLALDEDKAGRAAMMEVAQIFGPKVRLVNWSGNGSEESYEE